MTTDRQYGKLLDDARQGYRVERTSRTPDNGLISAEYLCPCGRWVTLNAEYTHKNNCEYLRRW
jgi:hypothetical protein